MWYRQAPPINKITLLKRWPKGDFFLGIYDPISILNGLEEKGPFLKFPLTHYKNLQDEEERGSRASSIPKKKAQICRDSLGHSGCELEDHDVLAHELKSKLSLGKCFHQQNRFFECQEEIPLRPDSNMEVKGHSYVWPTAAAEELQRHTVTVITRTENRTLEAMH